MLMDSATGRVIHRHIICSKLLLKIRDGSLTLGVDSPFKVDLDKYYVGLLCSRGVMFLLPDCPGRFPPLNGPTAAGRELPRCPGIWKHKFLKDTDFQRIALSYEYRLASSPVDATESEDSLIHMEWKVRH